VAPEAHELRFFTKGENEGTADNSAGSGRGGEGDKGAGGKGGKGGGKGGGKDGKGGGKDGGKGGGKSGGKGGRVFLHPSSINYKTREFETKWIVYNKKMATTKTWLHGVTMVPPYALLLFGGALTTQHAEGTIAVDDWIRFRANPKVAVLVRELRSELDKLLIQKFDDPSIDLGESDVVREILNLVNSAGLE